MQTSTISASDWTAFAEKFPAAELFLMQCSLRGELEYLELASRAGNLNGWQKGRLIDLREWREGVRELEKIRECAETAGAVC